MKSNLLAQDLTVGGQTLKGPLVGINNLGDVINKITPFLVSFAGLILLFVILWGGYEMMNSQGNPEKIKNAQSKLTSGFIGFILLACSYLIARLVAQIFNVGQGIF